MPRWNSADFRAAANISRSTIYFWPNTGLQSVWAISWVCDTTQILSNTWNCCWTSCRWKHESNSYEKQGNLHKLCHLNGERREVKIPCLARHSSFKCDSMELRRAKNSMRFIVICRKLRGNIWVTNKNGKSWMLIVIVAQKHNDKIDVRRQSFFVCCVVYFRFNWQVNIGFTICRQLRWLLVTTAVFVELVSINLFRIAQINNWIRRLVQRKIDNFFVCA